MTGPRFDFSCLSKKCRTDEGAAPVYEDLPAATKFCPVCKSKRIVKLFNTVHVMKSGFRPVNKIVDEEGARRMEIEHDRRDAFGRLQREGTSTFAVPVGNNGAIGPAVAKHLQRTPLAPAAASFQGLTVTPGASKNEGMAVQQRTIQGTGRPNATVLHKDTTKIAKRPDGLVEVMK